MKNAIIIGASSGIGRELAKVLSNNGYNLGIVARRKELLEDLKKELKTNVFIKQIDISAFEEAKKNFNDLLEEMKYVDLVIINAGIGGLNENLEWEKDKEKIDINVSGFVNIAICAMKYFIKRKKGHIVGTSSIASLRGNPLSPAYSASKAFISNYMEGLRLMAYKNNLEITITDIRPGVIDTDMTKDYRSFVKEPVSLAANQIFSAIKHKKKKVYIPRKWAFIAIFYKIFPEKIYNYFRKILLR